MKKIFHKLDKTKKIMLGILAILLIISITVFTNNRIAESKLKDPDKVVNELLSVFYKDEYNTKMAESILETDVDVYFDELENDLYKKVYKQLEELGDAPIIEGEDIIKISNEYSQKSLELLKKVKKYKIESKLEVKDGYNYTISVTPMDLTNLYDIKNTCIQKEELQYPEDNYKTLINYYCSKEAMKIDSNKAGESILINITLKKNEKGYYIPTEDSLNSLLSVVI